VVRFTPLPLYSRGKIPRYTLCKRLGGPRSRSGRYGENKTLLALPEIDPRLLGCPTHSIIAIPTEPYRLTGRLRERKEDAEMYLCTKRGSNLDSSVLAIEDSSAVTVIA
jgi:hypothetical protein